MAHPPDTTRGLGAQRRDPRDGDSTLWIIHRDDRGRAALARLVGRTSAQTVIGAPTDELFESAPEPHTVVLGLEGDFELELEFAHRLSGRLRGAHWLLVANRSELAEVRRLFDTVPAEVLPNPPDPAELRRHIRAGLAERGNDPLSRRRSRDLLAARFAHWFADLELSELIRALDPQLARVPVLILGEPGCGRSLVARYIHEFGGSRGGRGAGSLIHVPCGPEDRPGDLLERIADAIAATGRRGELAWTLWLEDVHCLPREVQRQLLGWVEFGLPPSPGPMPDPHWIASASDEHDGSRPGALDPALARALSGIAIRIPPLRDRLDAVESIVEDTARLWSRAHGQRQRRFGDDALRALCEYPWPGNLAELEAVVERTLAGASADPIREPHLRFEVADPTLDVPAAPVGPPSPDTSADEAPDRAAPVAEVVSPDPGPGEAEEEEAIVEMLDPVGAEPAADEAVQRLVGAVSHEMRNPLTTIRTFTELLPEHFDDEEFRSRFIELVGSDVRRMEAVLDQLQELAGSRQSEPTPVDVAGLLEELLEERRDMIRARGLLVLRELDRERPHALADAVQLQRALGGMLDRAFALVPERGDVYIASRHHRPDAGGRPNVRVLLRFDNGRRDRAATVDGTSASDTALEFVVAEAVIRAQGGTLTVDDTEGHETIVVIDLPAPATG